MQFFVPQLVPFFFCNNSHLKVLYMSFDKFLLTVESRDLKLTNNDKIIFFSKAEWWVAVS